MRCSLASSLAGALVLALAPALAGHSVALAEDTAPPSARERSQELLTEGDAALEREDLDGAIASYRAAYYGLSPADQASYVGSIPIRKAMAAYEVSVARQSDPAKRRQLLQSQRVLLAQFLLAVEARERSADEVGMDVLVELGALRRTLDDALVAEAPATVDPIPAGAAADEPASIETSRADASGPGASTPPIAPEGITDPSTPAPQPRRRDGLGLGLTLGGSTLVAAGLGVSVGWWTVPSQALAYVEAGGPALAEGTRARADYLAETDVLARNYLIAGSVIAGVGLGVTIAGIVRLAKHRRSSMTQSSAVHVVPISGSTMGGVTVVRF